MFECLSASEFARREGCDEKQVRRALERGALVRGADGLIDAAQLGSTWRRPNRRTLAKSAQQSAATDVAAFGPCDATAPTETTRRTIESATELLSLADALRVKENYLARLRQLEYEEREGRVIELALAQSVVFELFREARDAWLAWPVKVAPFVAVALDADVDKVAALLSEHVYQQLRELGEPQPDFSGD
jgi:hypothetical protein